MRIKQILIIISTLLIGSFIGYRFGLSQSSQFLKSIVEPGSMVTEASYVIFTGGTNIYARDGNTGEIKFQGTDATTVINTALNSLTPGRTWIEKVILKGDFMTDSPIEVASYTHLVINGRIILANGANSNIIQNKNPSTYDTTVIIEGGILDGNRDFNSGMSAIYWKHSTAPPLSTSKVEFRNLRIRNSDDHGIWIDEVGAGWGYYWFENIFIQNVDGTALRFYNVEDVRIDEIHLGADTTELEMINGSGVIATNLYINGRVYLERVAHSYFSTFFIDGIGDAPGIHLKGGYALRFENGDIHLFGSNGYQSNSAIYLESMGGTHSTDNYFVNIRTGRSVWATGNNQWAYGYQEVNSNQNRNTLIALDTRDVLTAGIVKKGIDTHVALSWNGTSWLP